MGIFGPDWSKTVSQRGLEMHVLPDLSGNGFSSLEITKVKELVAPMMLHKEPNEIEPGLSADEINAVAGELTTLGHLSPEKAAKFKEIATKYLGS